MHPESDSLFISILIADIAVIKIVIALSPGIFLFRSFDPAAARCIGEDLLLHISVIQPFISQSARVIRGDIYVESHLSSGICKDLPGVVPGPIFLADCTGRAEVVGPDIEHCLRRVL